MRVVGEVPHKELKITIFEWNNKYLIKIEKDLLEQTFKISQFDVTGEESLHAILNETFLNEATNRFQEMSQSLHKALEGT